MATRSSVTETVEGVSLIVYYGVTIPEYDFATVIPVVEGQTSVKEGETFMFAVETDEEICRVVDDVIAYIQGTGLHYQVGAFETTIEGESYDELMDIAKECLKVAVHAGAPKVSAYIKVVYRPEGDILTIEQKIGKYQ